MQDHAAVRSCGGRPQLGEKRRAMITAFVTANPGSSKRAVAEATGIPAGTCFHHIHRMIRLGLLVERRMGIVQPLFVPANAPDQAGTASFVLAREFPELLDAVRLRPGATETHLLDVMAEAGWARSTTQHRLKRLVSAGALARTRGMRAWHYGVPAVATPPLQARLAAVPA